MKISIGDIDFTKIFIADFYAGFILGLIKNTHNHQTGGCGGCPNQGNHQRRIRKRDTLPILGDESKQPVFNFVPFACSWRVMQYRYFLAGFIGQLLKLVFPKSVSVPVATAAISSDDDLIGCAI